MAQLPVCEGKHPTYWNSTEPFPGGMEALLAAVLSEQLGLPEAVAWALSTHNTPPPIHPRADGAWEGLAQGQGLPPAFGPAEFRVFLLNHVREQVELILAAAERDAAPSHPPTPDGQGATARGPAARREAGMPPHHAGPPGAAGAGPARHVPAQPGAVDDANFPALGAAVASGLKSRGASPQGKGKVRERVLPLRRSGALSAVSACHLPGPAAGLSASVASEATSQVPCSWGGARRALLACPIWQHLHPRAGSNAVNAGSSTAEGASCEDR